MSPSSAFWALVRKDVYLMRSFMVAAVATGLLSVGLALTGKVGFAVGGILFLTANVGSAIFIAMHSVLVERKEQARLFALSLPVSGIAYDRAKIVGASLSFAIPWVVLTALAVGLFLFVPEAPRGMVVYVVVVQGFVLAMFAAVLSALFIGSSEAFSGIVIMVVNVLFSLFMVVINQPAISRLLRGPEIQWSGFSFGMLAGEFAVIALAFVVVLAVTSRRRDFL